MVEIEWEQYFEYHHRIISEKIVRALDTGQLMGDPIYSCQGNNQDPKNTPGPTRPPTQSTCLAIGVCWCG